MLKFGISQAVFRGARFLAAAGVLACAGPTSAKAAPAEGWRFDFERQTWRPLPTASAPESGPRGFDSLATVTTGDRAIVFGSYRESSGRLQNGGAVYSFKSDTWTPLPMEGAPEPRIEPKVVFLDGNLWVWGGRDVVGKVLRSGAMLRPDGKTWTPISEESAPALAIGHVATDGRQLIAWGQESPSAMNSVGARYSLAENRWIPIPPINTPLAKYTVLNAVVDGKAVFWGSQSEFGCLPSGAYYSFAENRWTPIATMLAPPGCSHPTAYALPDGFLSWGGKADDVDRKLQWTAEGGIYNFKDARWSPMPTKHAPDLPADPQASLRYRSLFDGKLLSIIDIQKRDSGGANCHGAVFDLEKREWAPLAMSSGLLDATKSPARAARRLRAGIFPPSGGEVYLVDTDEKTGAVTGCAILPEIPAALEKTREESLLFSGEELIVLRAKASGRLP